MSSIAYDSNKSLGWGGITGASWPWVRSKAIDLASLTRVAWDAKRFMALDAIEGNRPRQFDSGGVGCQALHGLGCDRPRPFDSGGTGSLALHGLGSNRSYLKLFEVIYQGNQTHTVDSDGTTCQALHGLEINRRQSKSPV